LEWFSAGYGVAEGIASLSIGAVAGLVSLVGFGIDSVVEVVTAAVVLHRLRAEFFLQRVDERAERAALRFVGLTFFALAAYLAVEGVLHLAHGDAPDRTTAGIAVTAVSAVVMPALAAAKQRLGTRLESRLLLADAAESRLCGALSATTLVSLVVYRATGATWIDPVCGFVIALFALVEGREAFQTGHHGHHGHHSHHGHEGNQG
jgi:divalent metal cation (Fe/Co/Zn/Cd) transporter